MRRLCARLAPLAVIVGFMAAFVAAHAEDAEHKFIGVQKCGMCHKSEKKGDQLGQWEASKHAKAFETLASPEALKIAEEKGLDVPPQQADACLKCHVTGHGMKAEMFEASFKPEQGVQCETCHGAGSGYKSLKIMKDREASIAAGLIIPDENTCKRCHNEESPTYKGFDFDKAWAAIAHPNPTKQ